jgi:serine/threonine protein kinase
MFVVSFEMGRRKRQHEKDQQTMDLHKGKVPATTDSMVLSSGIHTHAVASTGVIKVYDDKILGYGGHGTVVFQGLLEGRQVAVKRMLKAYHGSADREISLLIESDGHPNVVRYFLKEVRGDFVYLALELCEMSLHELISQVRTLTSETKPGTLPQATRGILRQIAQGVKHLHGLRIVHRDLKPANILLARQSKKSLSVYDAFLQGYYVAKISDMGLGKVRRDFKFRSSLALSGLTMTHLAHYLSFLFVFALHSKLPVKAALEEVPWATRHRYVHNPMVGNLRLEGLVQEAWVGKHPK